MEIEDLASRVKHEGPRLSEDEVASFEKAISTRLPEDFRRFLLLTGGGGEIDEPLEYVWGAVDCPDAIIGGYWVELFCRPDGRDEYHSVRPLHRHIEDMEITCADVPDGIFVIADDLSGNFLTIDLRADHYGKIGIVDHETVGDHFDDPETYVVVAPNFKHFVAQLRSG